MSSIKLKTVALDGFQLSIIQFYSFGYHIKRHNFLLLMFGVCVVYVWPMPVEVRGQY